MAGLLEKIGDPIFFAVVCLCGFVVTLIGTYAVSAYIENWVPFYLGIIISVPLMLPALLLLTVFFLLWKNPERNKERATKKLRREKDELREEL